MAYSNQFENLHFNRTINTMSSCPAVFPLHWHKYVEIMAYPADSGASAKPVHIQIHQNSYYLAPGDLIFIWPGELHEITQNEGRKLIGFQFSPTFFNELPDFTPYLRHFRTYHHISATANPELAESLSFHLQHIMHLQKTSGTFHGVEAFICLLELFMDLGTQIKNTDSGSYLLPAEARDKTLEKMDAACNYISENCEQELTLDKVADFAGFSSCYFSRIFKQVTTYNFVDYLAAQRIRRAQSLLSDSNMSITEIAYQSGFKSISTFNRVFKQSRGCSPSEYRKYYFV